MSRGSFINSPSTWQDQGQIPTVPGSPIQSDSGHTTPEDRSDTNSSSRPASPVLNKPNIINTSSSLSADDGVLVADQIHDIEKSIDIIANAYGSFTPTTQDAKYQEFLSNDDVIISEALNYLEFLLEINLHYLKPGHNSLAIKSTEPATPSMPLLLKLLQVRPTAEILIRAYDRRLAQLAQTQPRLVERSWGFIARNLLELNFSAIYYFNNNQQTSLSYLPQPLGFELSDLLPAALGYLNQQLSNSDQEPCAADIADYTEVINRIMSAPCFNTGSLCANNSSIITEVLKKLVAKQQYNIVVTAVFNNLQTKDSRRLCELNLACLATAFYYDNTAISKLCFKNINVLIAAEKREQQGGLKNRVRNCFLNIASDLFEDQNYASFLAMAADPEIGSHFKEYLRVIDLLPDIYVRRLRNLSNKEEFTTDLINWHYENHFKMFELCFELFPRQFLNEENKTRGLLLVSEKCFSPAQFQYIVAQLGGEQLTQQQEQSAILQACNTNLYTITEGLAELNQGQGELRQGQRDIHQEVVRGNEETTTLGTHIDQALNLLNRNASSLARLSQLNHESLAKLNGFIAKHISEIAALKQRNLEEHNNIKEQIKSVQEKIHQSDIPQAISEMDQASRDFIIPIFRRQATAHQMGLEAADLMYKNLCPNLLAMIISKNGETFAVDHTPAHIREGIGYAEAVASVTSFVAPRAGGFVKYIVNLGRKWVREESNAPYIGATDAFNDINDACLCLWCACVCITNCMRKHNSFGSNIEATKTKSLNSEHSGKVIKRTEKVFSGLLLYLFNKLPQLKSGQSTEYKILMLFEAINKIDDNRYLTFNATQNDIEDRCEESAANVADYVNRASNLYFNQQSTPATQP